MKKTRVILTIDTEPSIAGALVDIDKFPPLLDEPVWGEVNGQSEALGFITRTLKNYGLKATFFVETAHIRYFGSAPMQAYVQHLSESNQDVQLHIHPVWQNFSLGDCHGAKYNDDTQAQNKDEYFKLVKEGCEQIKDWTGIYPIAMRTGCFSASPMVYEAMSAAGLKLSSNICLGYSKYADSILNHSGGVQKIGDIWELPATSFIDQGPVGKGCFRPLQITACSANELIELLKQSHKQFVETLVITTHPFEFIKKADFRYRGLRANNLVQRRWDKVCRFLAHHKDSFEVVTFGEVGSELPLCVQPAPQLKVSAIKSLYRSMQNFINDRI